MSAQRDLELELDQRIDSWRSDDRRSTSAGGEMVADADGGDGEISELMQLVGLVAEYGFPESTGETLTTTEVEVGTGGRRSASGFARKGAWALRVAAVIVLVAALAIGLGVGLGRDHGAGQPTNSGPKIPASLLQALENDAGFYGDPYPARPIQWVKTTTTRIDSSTDLQLFGPHWRTAVPKTVWIGELSGNFYGQPETRSGLFHTDLAGAFIGRGEHVPTVAFGEIGRYYSLSEWGTVNYYLIPRPPAHPPVQPLPPLVGTVLENDAALNGQPYPGSPVLWTTTTLGQFVSSTGLRPGAGIGRLASGARIGVAEMRLGAGVPAAARTFWIVWSTGGAHYSYLGAPPGGLARLDTAGALSRLGLVREAFVGPSLPANLPGYVTPLVAQDVANRDLGRTEPSRVAGSWTVTTVSALEQAVLPQVNDWLQPLPGGMPVFVIELHVRSSRTSSRLDWVLVTPQPNGNSGLRTGTSSEGGSGLWGITKLSQLGRVRQVFFDRSGGGYTIAG